MRLIIPLAVVRIKRDLELGIASAAYANAGSQHQTHNRRKSKPQQQLKSQEAQGDLYNETTDQGEDLNPGEFLCPPASARTIPRFYPSLKCLEIPKAHKSRRRQCTGKNSHSTTQKTQEAQTKRAPRG
jgi:hypothetical protein